MDTLDRDRSEREAVSSAYPCEVTAVAGATVTIRPLVAIPYETLDGVILVDEPLEVAEVPYSFPSSSAFALYVPPEVGMLGLFIVSDTEIGEIPEGEAISSRQKNPTSGYFMPTGKADFEGSPDWAELRSADCRIALSDDTVHLEAGDVSVVLTGDSFDVVIGGVSLIGALKQMSAHIRRLELLVHPNGMPHGPAQIRQIDSIANAGVPTRDERGV